MDEMRWMERREEEKKKKPELEGTEREAKNLGLGPIGRSKSLTSNYTSYHHHYYDYNYYFFSLQSKIQP